MKQIVDFAIGAAVFLFVGAGVCLGCYLAFFLILACNKEGVLMLEPDPDVRAKRTLGAVIAARQTPPSSKNELKAPHNPPSGNSAPDSAENAQVSTDNPTDGNPSEPAKED